MTPEDFIKLFGRHIVSLAWLDESGVYANENGGRGRNFVITAFVVSVRGVWFLITAGHIIADIETALANGQPLTGFRVHDNWGPIALYPPQIFDYKGSPKYHHYDKTSGIDFGAIMLDENIKARLGANGVVAIPEDVWATQPERVDVYFIVGFPSMWQSTKPLARAMMATNALVLKQA